LARWDKDSLSVCKGEEEGYRLKIGDNKDEGEN